MARTNTNTGGGGGGGTVTQVNTSGPITGGPFTTSGTIGISQSGAASNGYLSSTDWNTFNNKGNGTVTSVAASGGTTGLTFGGSPITTAGTVTLAGVLNLANGGTGSDLSTVPIFNSLWGYDVTDGAIKYWSLGAGLSYNHTTHTLSSTTPLNQITGALAAGAAQDSFNNKIDWQWNSLGANTGLALSSNGTQAAGNLQTLFSVSIFGTNATANQETVAVKFSNTHGGTNASNVTARFTASGGATNTAIDVTAGDINQAGGNISTSGTLTIGGNTTITGGGKNITTPTTNGSLGDVVVTDGVGHWSYTTFPSPSAPGGSDMAVQYNSGPGSFAGVSDFTWDNSNRILGVNGFINVTAGAGTALSLTSDALAGVSLSGNSLTGLSLTSGGNGGGIVGMYENDTSSLIAGYTGSDNIFSNPWFFFANRHIGYDVSGEKTWLGDIDNINNGTTLVSNDDIKATTITNAFATPTMENDSTGGVLVTIPDGVRGYYYNPGSVIASVNFTLPANPVDGQELILGFGGTLDAGVSVVTTATILPNTGQRILQGTIIVSTRAGDTLTFKWSASQLAWYTLKQ